MRENVAILLILLFFSALSTAAPLPVKAEPRTILVPDDYSTIQEAVDHATEGDTVFVKKGIYNARENYAVNIDKSIALVGENSQDTIVNGVSQGYSEAVIMVEADSVTVSGLTLNGSMIGVYLWNTASNCRIIGNTITNNNFGVYVGASNSNIISGNSITESQSEGIFAQYSSDIVISENHIRNSHRTGMKLSYCQNITVKQNEIAGNAHGLALGADTEALYVYQNNITDNFGFGVQFDEANATVHNNNVRRNGIGINLQNFEVSPNNAKSGLSCSVYYNNFVDNAQNAVVQHTYPWINRVSINGTDVTSWDNGKIGNYWSDYQSKYPNAKTIDALGIGNIPYAIDKDNLDNYPLMQEVDISTILLESDVEILLATVAAITAASVVAVIIGLVVYFKRNTDRKQRSLSFSVQKG